MGWAYGHVPLHGAGGRRDTDGISIPANPVTTNEADRIYNSWNREAAELTFAGLTAPQSGHKVNATGGTMQQQAPAPALSWRG